MRIGISTLNFLWRRARERATFMRLAGTYCNAFDEAGTRQGISSALNCIHNFFRADYNEASYPLFFTGFLLAGGITQPISSGRHSNSYCNVFSICVQNFIRIKMSTVIVLKIQLLIFFINKRNRSEQAGTRFRVGHRQDCWAECQVGNLE